MAPIGPQLPPSPVRDRPPHVGPSPCSAKQRSSKSPDNKAPTRNSNEIQLDDSDSDSASDAGFGPSAGPTSQQPAIGPSPPDRAEIHTSKTSRPIASKSSDASSDSDEDDDFGPAPPSANTQRATAIGPSLPPAEAAPQRDSWMVVPPTAQGYTERDPTRIRNRKFASKPTAVPSSSSSAAGVSSIWTETPEEKLRRLQDSVLGRADVVAQSKTGVESGKRRRAEERERDRKISANIEAQRGGSLYDEHSKRRRKGGVKAGIDEEDDDPSKRAFDKEKDMALGGKIGTAQRRELVSKAANFGGRFQKGSYL